MSTTRRLLGAATAAALALTTAVALATPSAAAPPPATHDTTVHPNPLNTTAQVMDGRTEAVLDLGSRVIVGGKFSQVRNADRTGAVGRSNLFAYDKATGRIDPAFRPQPDGKVTALLRAADGSVLVAGQFKTIGGTSLRYLVKLDPVTGAVRTGFAPQPTGMVYDIHQANGLVYLGGSFTSVKGVTRRNFAVVDATTGAVKGNEIAFTDAPTMITRVQRFDITPNGRKLVAIGNFAKVAGRSRPNVAVLDLGTDGSASVNGWYTDDYRYNVCGGSWDTITYDVDISPDGKYFVIVTTGGPRGKPTLCDTATRWETSANGTASPTWVNYTGGDSLTSVAISGAAVYVAGHNRWVDSPTGRNGTGATPRNGIAALSPSTGRALSWNPGRERGLVAPRLVVTGDSLFVLSDSDLFAQELRPRLAHLTLTGTLPTTPPATAVPGAPGAPAIADATATTATLQWDAPLDPGTSAVNGYRVTVHADAAATAVATVDLGAATTATISGLAPGRLYRFTVAARNSSGRGPASGASDRTILPFTSLHALIDRQHQDLLGRLATDAEESRWLAQLRGGTAPATLVAPLLDQGHAARSAAVSRLYQAYFLRPPDKSGLDFWVDKARRGASLHWISQSFSASREFRQRYGSVDDAGFVRLVYQNVLGRQPDAKGLAFWTAELRRGTTRGRVMVGFSESSEYKRQMQGTTDVVAAFRYLLGRLPSGAETTTWKGQSRTALVQWILTQPAYASRV